MGLWGRGHRGTGQPEPAAAGGIEAGHPILAQDTVEQEPRVGAGAADGAVVVVAVAVAVPRGPAVARALPLLDQEHVAHAPPVEVAAADPAAEPAGLAAVRRQPVTKHLRLSYRLECGTVGTMRWVEPQRHPAPTGINEWSATMRLAAF